MMVKLTVYRFKYWNAVMGDWVTSTRMGTREGIGRLRDHVCIESSATEIDAALLGREDPGLTDIDFQP